MSRTWWDGLLPVEVRLDCSGANHTICWRDGVVDAVDHEDPEGERTLAALGGTRSPCIELLDIWARHADDLRVLTIASRGASDPVHPVGESRFVSAATGSPRGSGGRVARISARAATSGWVAYSPQSPNPMTRARPGLPPDEVLDLLALGGAVTQRLVAEILATWSLRLTGDEAGTAGYRPAITAALYGRLLASVRTWLGDDGTAVELEMIGPTVTPSMARRDGVVHARLPFAWLADIWVKDLAVVLGRFSLGTVQSEVGRLRLATVGPDCTEVRPVTVSLE